MTLHRALGIADALDRGGKCYSATETVAALTRLAKEVRDRQAGAEWVRERLDEIERKIGAALDDLR